MKLKRKGFTLIELLVVISIISVLASVIFASFNAARAKARDARRLADMREIQIALALYYDSNLVYPGDTNSYGEAEGVCGTWDTSNVDNNGDGMPFISPLVTSKLMSSVPNDPSGSGTCTGFTYRYFRYNAGDWGCDPARGSYYVLEISQMETADARAKSPGFVCSGRDWSVEFPPGSGIRSDWVIGQFEH